MHSGQDIGDGMDLVQLLDVDVPSEMLKKEGSWRIHGSVTSFPMFAGAYLFSLELVEDPHNDILDAAPCFFGGVAGLRLSRGAPHALRWRWSVEKDGGQKDGEAHVLVRRSRGRLACLEICVGLRAECQPRRLLWDFVLGHV